MFMTRRTGSTKSFTDINSIFSGEPVLSRLDSGFCNASTNRRAAWSEPFEKVFLSFEHSIS